jgi:SAM-dependent methyltransferase
MSKEKEIRTAVSESYARAVTRPSPGGCCSGEPKGVAVKLAGYTNEELKSLPPDSVVNSFGCGNPVATSEIREGDTVLDLGSGAGIDILLAARKVGPTGRAIGIDMTDEMIEKAEENIRASGLSNVEVRRGIIEDLPVEDGSVDWVISNCVINLSPEKPKVFAEIARVLRPGGRMLVSDIVVEELPQWVREDKVLYSSCIGGAISEAGYVEGLRAAGLDEVTVRDRLVYDPAQLESLSESECGPESGSSCCGGMDEETVRRAVSDLENKVRSALFYARKPG